MISTDQVLQNLQHGVTMAATAVDSYSSASPVADRLRAITELSCSITWCKTAGRKVVAAQATTATNVQVVAVSPGDTNIGLSDKSNWQTQTDADGQTRVYVGRAPCTTPWAGIVLFHELSHVLDHQDGTWASDWWASEAKAYQLEADLIDTITGGRYLTALRKFVAAETESALFTTQGLEKAVLNLYQDMFPARLQEAPGGPQEDGARMVALGFSIALASWAAPREIEDFTDISDAAPTLKRLADVLEV